jgi:hypothetical protein
MTNGGLTDESDGHRLQVKVMNNPVTEHIVRPCRLVSDDGGETVAQRIATNIVLQAVGGDVMACCEVARRMETSDPAPSPAGDDGDEERREDGDT